MLEKERVDMKNIKEANTAFNLKYQIARVLAFGLGFILLELINQYFYTEAFELQILLTKGLQGMLVGVFVLNFNWFWKKIGLGKRD